MTANHFALHVPVVVVDGTPYDLSNLMLDGIDYSEIVAHYAPSTDAEATCCSSKRGKKEPNSCYNFDFAKYPRIDDIPRSPSVSEIFDDPIGIMYDEANAMTSENSISPEEDSGPLRLEITPGNFVSIRGTEETMEAVVHGRTAVCTCFGCGLSLVTVQNADMVLCYCCRAVSPVESIKGGGGLGIGMSREEAKYERQRFQETRRPQLRITSAISC